MEIIRKATLQDKNQLKKIKTSLTNKQILDRLKRQTKRKVEYLVLEVDKEIVAFILLKWQGKKTHPEYPDMEDLYVVKNERGKGYAKKLLAECEKLARIKGFEKIGLASNKDLNYPATKLYLKLGYVHDGRKSYIDGVYNGVEDRVIDLDKEIKTDSETSSE